MSSTYIPCDDTTQASNAIRKIVLKNNNNKTKI